MKLVKLSDEDTCLQPRIVMFTGRHDFVAVKRRKGPGYVARCRFCGVALKRKKRKTRGAKPL